MGDAIAPEGWYPDPDADGLLRRWDGQRWTEESRPAPPAGWYRDLGLVESVYRAWDGRQWTEQVQPKRGWSVWTRLLVSLTVAMTVLLIFAVLGALIIGVGGTAWIVGMREVGTGIFTVAWSPDGTQIAYEADNGVWVVPSDGSGAPRRVHPDGETPLWAPNGLSLAFTTWDYECSASTLWVVDVDSAETRHLADCVRGYDWSPTSQSLAFTDPFAVDVYVVDAASGLKRLLFSTTDDIGRAWSHDGRSIIFAGTPVGHAVDGLWAAPVDGGQLRLIAEADSGYFIDDFVISPSGRQMALLEIRDQPEAYDEAWLIVDSDGSDRRRVEYSDRPQWIVKAQTGLLGVWWSPDGTRRAGIAGSGTASELWVQRMDGGQRVVIVER